MMTGNKIQGRTFMIDIDHKQEEITSDDINIIDVTTDPDILAVAPCGSHPPGQNFSDCFVQEWKEFCSDVPGCVTQFAKPYLVVAAITIHCIGCTI